MITFRINCRVMACNRLQATTSSSKGTKILRGSRTSISQRMKDLKKANKVAFIPYICAGDPDLDTTKKAIEILDEHQADVIEIGIPYSDPLADGPVIHNASIRALNNGTKMDDIFNMLKPLIPNLSAPIVVFTYFNPILKRGIENFVKSLKEIGIAGLLVPDIPFEETEETRIACNKNGIELVLLTTPTTPVERMKSISELSQGFVYLVSVVGVTGVRAKVSDRVKNLVETLHEISDSPVCVGFGVSDPEQAKEIVSYGAEGVISGSAFVKLIGESESKEEGLIKLKELARDLREAIP